MIILPDTSSCSLIKVEESYGFYVVMCICHRLISTNLVSLYKTTQVLVACGAGYNRKLKFQKPIRVFLTIIMPTF